MSVTRRTFLAMSAAAGVLAGPALGVARAATAQTKPVRVGYIADYFGTSLTAIASDQEMWAKHGLEPELKVFTNGPIQIQALGAGSLDFGYVGPGALWLPASGKAKLIAMNALGLSDRVIEDIRQRLGAGLHLVHEMAQVAERDTHIRELEMENIKLRANQQRVRDVLLTST